jgi:truncated hemoglobin YjbI
VRRGSRRFATGGVQLLAGEPRSFLVAERPLGQRLLKRTVTEVHRQSVLDHFEVALGRLARVTVPRAADQILIQRKVDLACR